MSEENQELESMKRVLNTLAFIHQKMVATQFYPEEFESVKVSLEWIQNFAKDLDKKIMAQTKEEGEPSEEAKEAAKGE